MAGMNTQRVLTGGLIAGVVINIVQFLLNGVLFASRWRAWAEARRNLLHSMPQSAAGATWTLTGLLWGIAGMWLYAAIRPRFGPGPRTAIIAGLALGVIGWVLPGIGHLVQGDIPRRMLAVGIAISLGGTLAALLAGAYFYKEPS